MAVFSDLPGKQRLTPGIVKVVDPMVGRKTWLDHSPPGTGMDIPLLQYDVKELFSEKLGRMIPVIRHNNGSRCVL